MPAPKEVTVQIGDEDDPEVYSVIEAGDRSPRSPTWMPNHFMATDAASAPKPPAARTPDCS